MVLGDVDTHRGGDEHGDQGAHRRDMMDEMDRMETSQVDRMSLN
jgi:hypothetical protein